MRLEQLFVIWDQWALLDLRRSVVGTVGTGYWVDFLRSSFVLGTFDKKLIQAFVRDSGYGKRHTMVGTVGRGLNWQCM